MRAGILNRRITLQRATFSKDAFNADVATWENICPSVWAATISLSSSEQMIAREKAADMTSQFLIRKNPTVADLNPKDRLLFENRTYDILSVDPADSKSGVREGLLIAAKARAD